MVKAMKKYIEVEKHFFSALKKEFGKYLVLYCVTGSLGRGEITDGWSDIDILLVFDLRFDEEFFCRLRRIIDRKYSIKIGCTFYTVHEFKNGACKDAKTLHSISFINSGIYSPRINKTANKLKDMDMSLMSNYDLADFAGGLHQLKRELLTYPELNEKKIVKIIFKMMKIILRKNDYLVYGYKDTVLNFRRLCPDFKKVVTPVIVMKNIITFKQRYKSYLAFLAYVESKLNIDSNIFLC
jgi:hypothetical protein